MINAWFMRAISIACICNRINKKRDNEQSMDVLLAVGVGYYDLPISRMFIGETNFETFGEFINYSLFNPGVNVSSHQAHKCWYNAPEVGYTDSSSGLRLAAGAYGTKYMSGYQYVISGQQITIPISRRLEIKYRSRHQTFRLQ